MSSTSIEFRFLTKATISLLIGVFFLVLRTVIIRKMLYNQVVVLCFVFYLSSLVHTLDFVYYV